MPWGAPPTYQRHGGPDRHRGIALLLAPVFAVLLLAVPAINAARAACTSPAGVAAEVIYNSSEYIPQYCDGGQWIAMGPISAGPGGDCINPPGAAGTLIYSTDYNVPQFCNGGQWVAMGPVPGAGGAGCSTPSGPPGAMIYNNDSALMQYCDGTNWIALRGYHSAAVNTCDDPNTFDFTDDPAAPLNTVDHPSDIVQVNGGFTCTVNVSVSGNGNPEFRICNDGTCTGVAVNWGSTPQTITSGQWVQVRLDTPDSHSVVRTATLIVGQDTADWIATTPACDNTPNSFTAAFTDVTNQLMSDDVLSNIVQITGIENHAECGGAVTISGTASDEQFRICGSGDPGCGTPGAWTTSAAIDNNEYLQLRMTTSPSQTTALTAIPNVGGVTDTWQTTTLTCDNTPATFTFTDQTDVATGTIFDSNIVQITGITPVASGCGATAVLTGDATAKYRICNDGTCSADPAWGTANQTVDNNQWVQARVTSAGAGQTQTDAILTVGTGADTFSVTTADTEKFIFVTSTSSYKANGFSGIAGADTECANHASGNLAGTYKAWISASGAGNDAASRLTQATIVYKLPSGTTVANNWTDLTDGTLAVAINQDETGAAAPAQAWTGTLQDGTFNATPNSMCDDWTFGGGGSKRASVGSTAATDATWTNSAELGCASTAALYCVEQ